MKLGNLSVLGVALATALAATACNRADDTASTYGEPATSEPATSTAPPSTETTTPPGTTAGTDTAATGSATAPEAAEPTAAPTTTMADATTPFDDMDINKDGSLSQDELSDSHPLRQGFTVVDSDSNGMLSRSEVDDYRSRMTPPGG